MKWDTNYLIPGMVLKEDLLSDTATIGSAPLLPQGKVLTIVDIARLKEHGIDEVEIVEYNETFFEVFRKFAQATVKSCNISSISRVAAMYEYIASKTKDFKFDMTKYLNEDASLFKINVDMADMAVAMATKYNEVVAAKDRIPIRDIAEAAMLCDIGRRANVPSVLERIKQNFGSKLDKLQNIYPGIPNDVFDYYHPKLHSFYGYLILKGSKLNNTHVDALQMDVEFRKHALF